MMIWTRASSAATRPDGWGARKQVEVGADTRHLPIRPRAPLLLPISRQRHTTDDLAQGGSTDGQGTALGMILA